MSNGNSGVFRSESQRWWRARWLVEAALRFVPTGAVRARTEVHRLALADALQLTDIADARDNAGFGVGTRPVVRLITFKLTSHWETRFGSIKTHFSWVFRNSAD
jgi:hypothetical protein